MLYSSTIIAAMTVSEIIKTIGGPVAVSREMGIRSQAVSLWIRSNRIPAERVPALERMCKARGLKVRAEQMRPDIEWSVLRS
jgi:DNA-binding transcriptional regulator YdaS (Cro superfamily)